MGNISNPPTYHWWNDKANLYRYFSRGIRPYEPFTEWDDFLETPTLPPEPTPRIAFQESGENPGVYYRAVRGPYAGSTWVVPTAHAPIPQEGIRSTSDRRARSKRAKYKKQTYGRKRKYAVVYYTIKGQVRMTSIPWTEWIKYKWKGATFVKAIWK